MNEWLEMKPGVTWRVVGSTAYWRGTAQALVEAGICKAHQFPGMPGNGEAMSSFNPDGTKPRQGSRIRKRTPGSITIVARGSAFVRYYEVRMMLQPTTRAQAPAGPPVAVLPALETQDAIDTVLDDLSKLDNSINVLAKLPAPASRVTAASLQSIRAARTQLQATIATAEWEVA